MLSIISRIIELQREWSEKNTPEMRERGELIRHALPLKMQALKHSIAETLNVDESDVLIQGRDGSGRKTAIPWVRICSNLRSPTPQDGWYVVLLFHSEKRKFYLAIIHGATTWTNGGFKPKPSEQMRQLASWAQIVLSEDLKTSTDLLTSIELGTKGNLGGAYETSTAVCKPYEEGNLPTDDEFIADLLRFVGLLHTVYEHSDRGEAPDAAEVEFGIYQNEVKAAEAGKRLKHGQGFGLNAAERKAVEQRAMTAAIEHFKSNGYKCRNTSESRPYDLEITKNDENIVVEVKGTTSSGAHILMTANEVQVHKTRFPNNALCVVHGIKLKRERNGSMPTASGGILVVSKPWDIGRCQLKALAYQVEL